MNPKVVFLMYGVFAVGSTYQVKAQVISTLTGDATPTQEKYANENFAQFGAGKQQQGTDEFRQQDEAMEHSRAPAANEEWQSGNSGLIYYCRFSDKGLKKLVC